MTRKTGHRLAVSGRWLIVALALALVAVACKGGTQSASSPVADSSPTAGAEASPTAEGTASVEDIETLLQMVLQIADVPEGLVQAGVSSSTNQTLADAAADPEKELAKLERLGRITGYEVQFIPGPDFVEGLKPDALTSGVSVYTGDSGASASFAGDAEKARTADWVAAYPKLSNIDVSKQDRPDLADEALWVRISGIEQAEGTGSGSLYIEDQLLMRRGRVRLFLRQQALLDSADRDAIREVVAAMAARQIELVDAALAG